MLDLRCNISMESDNEIVVSHSSDISGECVSVIDRENDGDSHCRFKRLDSDSDSAHKKASKDRCGKRHMELQISEVYC